MEQSAENMRFAQQALRRILEAVLDLSCFCRKEAFFTKDVGLTDSKADAEGNISDGVHPSVDSAVSLIVSYNFLIFASRI